MECENSAPRHECRNCRSLATVFASFLVNGIIFGIINTYGVIYDTLQSNLAAAGVSEASSKASLVGSLAIGTTFFLSALSGILSDKFGLRLVAFVGGLIASLGMFSAAFSCHSVQLLYVTFGVMFGAGVSLAYTPSIVILGHCFKEYIGIANGFVTCGSCVFTIALPYIIQRLLVVSDLKGSLLFLSILTSFLMPCALVFKPLTANKPAVPDYVNGKHHRKSKRKIENILNLSIWKRPRYVLWAVIVPCALLGYFVPYVHLVKFVELSFPDGDGKTVIMCLGLTSGVGRLIFGKLADHDWINKIVLQQVSLFVIGVLTLLLPLITSFSMLIVLVLLLGIFDGCFISMMGPIACDLCGSYGASQGLGFVLCFASIPMTIGPPVAGMIFDHTGSYSIPFIIAGVPPILGAFCLFFIRFVKPKNIKTDEFEQNTLADVKTSMPTITSNGNCKTDSVTLPPSYKEVTSEEIGENSPLAAPEIDVHENERSGQES